MDWGEKNWWKTHDWQSNHLFVFFVCLQVWRIFSVFPQEKEFEMSHYNHNDVHLYYLYHHHLDDEKWWEIEKLMVQWTWCLVQCIWQRLITSAITRNPFSEPERKPSWGKSEGNPIREKQDTHTIPSQWQRL